MFFAEGWTIRKIIVHDDGHATIDFYEKATAYISPHGTQAVDFHGPHAIERATTYAALTGGDLNPRPSDQATVRLNKGQGVVFKNRGDRGRKSMVEWAKRVLGIED